MNAVEPSGNGAGYQTILDEIQADGLSLLGDIPYDAAVAKRSMEAMGVMDLPPDGPTLQAVGNLVEQLDV